MSGRGPISKLIGGAVDFTKEYRADQKERKEARERNEQAGGSSNASTIQKHQDALEDESSSDDEEDWAIELDEAQQRQQPGQSHQADDNADPEELLRRFIEQHPPPPYEAGQQTHALPMPVILPQRRPEARHRGFVRAYAPVLNECGIDQTAWLEFLDGFEKSIKLNPWFNVLNAGVMVADHAHMAVSGFSPIAMLVTFAIHTSLETSRRTYVNYRQNGYLDTMNEKFFKPRGLFCLIVKYKPSSTELIEDIDLEHNIAKAVDDRDGQSKWKNAVRSASTTTKSEVEIPEPAPLVFPQLDALDEGKKQNAVKEFGQFVSTYFDRRAASHFQAQHPDSKIPQAPQLQQSIPSTSSSSGGLLSMATGGKVVGPIGRIQQRRNDRREELGIDRKVGRQARRERRRERKKNRPLKKMMKQDALYLMVVNLPTQEEMDAVAALRQK
ncbi:hypothetical protein CCHR01_00161 [Colletotrichum chrysophilum]|uniref:Uncharacterized protein n=1 Tax=Colletotrichum chrysophilum TaxID=1836956 RepID=A0AAD9ERE4_9PEZI|nr:hypothetical protein CCHR01_00161 [Colletotrichum chrysophilum]